PSKDEQFTAEFKLKDHLDWWVQNGAEANKALFGANDVPLDARGVPLAGVAPGSRGERLSTQMAEGELFGARTEADPVPFWLEGGRKIPNFPGFKVPSYAVSATRIRRHSGMAFIGSFPTGPESLERRFAVTIDLRLVPTTKVKPDSGSAFHGIELNDD